MRAKYMRYASTESKLFSRSKENNGCLEWTAGKDRCGYGRIWYKGENATAHTVAFETWVADIPDGMHVLHSCDNPACIHPEHLRLGTHAENMLDKSTRRRIHGEKNPIHRRKIA